MNRLQPPDYVLHSPVDVTDLPDEQQLTSKETAALLRICKATLWRLTARGELPSIGDGRLRRYSLRDIRLYQERKRK